MADQTVDSLLASLASMGFEMDQCQRAVQAGKLTVQDAVEWILQGGHEQATIPVLSPPSSSQTNPTLSLPIGQRTPSLASDPLTAPASSAPYVVQYSPPSPPTAPAATTASSVPADGTDEGKFKMQDVHSRFSLDEQKRQQKESWQEKQRKQATIEAKERRIAEKKAKDQIMKEIAADREAQKSRRAQLSKSSPEGGGNQEKPLQTTTPTPAVVESKPTTSCMLQIRLPTGQSMRQNFQPDSTLGEVMKFVLQHHRSLSNVGFMQPFPRREFTEVDLQSTLQELGLTPNGSLVVKKLEGPPQKVRKENTSSLSQPTASEGTSSESAASPSSASEGSVPMPPSSASEGSVPMPQIGNIPPQLPRQLSPQHSWGKGQALSSPERNSEEDEESVELEDVPWQPYVGLGEDDEEGEEENNSDGEEYENIAVPGAVGGWHPPPAPVGMFGAEGLRPQHEWGSGQSLQGGGPGRGAGFGYGFGGDQQEVPNAQRAAAAALERFERARHESPAQRPSGSSARGLHSNVQPLTDVCIAAVAKRICNQHQSPILHLGALPLDVAERILKVMMKEGTLRPKTLQPFLACRLRHLVLDCYKYCTNELLLGVRRHTNLVHLSLASCPLINDAGLAPLTTLKKLKHLNLSSCRQLTDKVFDTIREFPNLVILSLEETGVTDRGVQFYVESKPTNLLQLNLNRTNVSDNTLQTLSALPQLKVLGLEGTKITSLQSIQSLNNLQSLNIAATNLKARELQCLKLPALTSLNISQTQEMLGDDALKNLTGLQLSYLHLPSRHTTTDEGLQYIAAMPLVSLDLTDYIHITDVGIQHIAGMTSLQTLSLSNTKITDKAMEYIRGLVNLVELELDKTAITNVGATVIGNFTKLQVLGLASTGVSSKLLCHGVLNKCVMLNKLNLSRSKVCDKGLTSLQLPYLTLINLDSSYVTTNAEQHLSNGCPHLRVIRMQNLLPRPLDLDNDED